jgi:hypothetical protein
LTQQQKTLSGFILRVVLIAGMSALAWTVPQARGVACYDCARGDCRDQSDYQIAYHGSTWCIPDQPGGTCLMGGAYCSYSPGGGGCGCIET